MVRILADKGGGRYEGVVSGVRVSFSSAKPLAAGSSFIATVQVKGNTIVLVPKEAGSAVELGGGAAGIEGGLKILESGRVAELLMELGLPADGLSAALLQMTKQVGMRMEPALLARVRALALRFGLKAKLAAELAVMLSEKGIVADEDALGELLRLLGGEENEGREASGGGDLEKGKQLLNRVNSTEGSWFIFPFNMIQQKDGEMLGSGNIRLLFTKDKKIKLINVFCNYFGADYYFCCNCSEGKWKTLKANVQKDGVENSEIINHLKKHFETKIPGLKVEWTEKEDIEGSASGCEELYSFGGEV